MIRGHLSTLLAAGAITIGLAAFIACDSDTGRRSSRSTAGTDESEAVPEEGDGMQGPPSSNQTIEGDTVGTQIPRPDSGDDLPSFDGGGETDTRCCMVTVSIADATNNEATAAVIGDAKPFEGTGAPLTYRGGRWSANVCLPLNVRVTYGFEFNRPAAPTDLSDGGYEASTRDVRYASDAPNETNGLGFTYNVYGPVSDCALIDASAGMSH